MFGLSRVWRFWGLLYSIFIVCLWYIYPIFILYLSYIYSIFILCCRLLLVWFFISLVEKYYTKFTCNVLFGLNCVKTNIISVAPTALFYLWFYRGLHPCLCYFVPPGLLRKISMNYQEYFFTLSVLYCPSGTLFCSFF